MGRVGSRLWGRDWGVILIVALLLTGVSFSSVGQNDSLYGAHGPEGPRLREQLWIVPGSDPSVPLRSTLFRPPEHVRTVADGKGSVRYPLVVINHGSDDDTREAVSMPVFYWLSRWFVDRGYAVLLPQRRGHGATAGDMAEGKDTCARPDHYAAGMAAAADVEAALRYMAKQDFIDASRLIVVGISTGGWASLALASKNPAGVELVINFAGGRGAYAYGKPNRICGADRLIEAAAAYGRTARVPTLWVYSANDSYFGPDIAQAMAQAWQRSGGSAELVMLPPYGNEGHEIASDRAGWRLWGRQLETSLGRTGGSDKRAF